MKNFKPYIWLIALGAGWGLTVPLSKIAVSTGHGHFGLIFWQLVIAMVILGVTQIFRRRKIPFSRPVIWFYLAIALIGTLIPNSASYQALTILPSGIFSMLLSLIPMLAFPIALGLGIDQFSIRRLLGLSFGLAAVLLIVGVPDVLPSRAVLLAIPVGLIAPIMYAFESNFVAKWGTGGAGPLQLMLGASTVGALICLPLALASGQFINPFDTWGPAEIAIFASACIHAVVYTLFINMIRTYGPVFSIQVSYLVTTFGFIWAMLILNERFSPFIWLALGLIFIGIYLVRPKTENSNGTLPAVD